MKKLLALFLALWLCCLSAACAAGPSIQVAAVDGNTLDLTLSGLPAGRLVAAVYRDNRMVSAAVQTLAAGATAVTLTFQRQLQENDTVKAFLLGQDSAAPLIDAAELPLPKAESGKVLVAYFSCTNTTKAVAEKLARATGGDLFEIVPAVPYTAADLNYNTDCRANAEQNDDSARPAIAASCKVANWAGYDTVFLGHPIWWGIPPKILRTFCEQYDWTGKTVVGFCTSGGSGYSNSGLPALTAGAVWKDTRRLNGASQATVDAWVESLGLSKKEESTVNKLTVTFNGHTYTATLADNPSVDAFVDYLKSQGGSVTVHAHDYGSFEKVGELGTTLVQTNTQINTVPGDLILYEGSNVCLYYSTNAWNFTRLGKLEGDLSNLRSDLGSGNVDIVYALS